MTGYVKATVWGSMHAHKKNLSSMILSSAVGHSQIATHTALLLHRARIGMADGVPHAQ